MTSEEWKKLNDYDKNEQIMFARGYRLSPSEMFFFRCEDEPGVSLEDLAFNCEDTVRWDEMPDFLCDLDACHEFEDEMDGAEQVVYGSKLEWIAQRGEDDEVDGLRWAWNATAAQRCLAFIQAMEVLKKRECKNIKSA